MQRSLFAGGNSHIDAVADVKHEINQRIGRYAVRSGTTLTLPDMYSDTSHDFDVCDICLAAAIH